MKMLVVLKHPNNNLSDISESQMAEGAKLQSASEDRRRKAMDDYASAKRHPKVSDS